VRRKALKALAQVKSLTWLWPALLPLFAVWAGTAMFQLFLDPTYSERLGQFNIEKMAAVQAARFWVAGSLFLFTIVCLGALATTVYVGLRLGPRVRRSYWIAGGVITVTALITSQDRCSPMYLCLSPEVFQRTSTHADQGLLLGISFGGTTIAIVVGAMLAVAVAALGRRLPAHRSLAGRARLLAERIRMLQLLLVAASAVLFAGVMHAKAWHDWPTPYLAAPAKSLYADLASATIGFQALHFAIILAAMFLPTAFVLSSRATQLAALGVADGSPASEGQRTDVHGLAFSIKDWATTSLGLIAPLLAPPVAELLRWLAGTTAN
jgi:hypothetical protein